VDAVAFLARDPIGNVELLTALRYDADIQCIGAFPFDGGAGFSLPNGDFQAQACTTDSDPLGILVAAREGMDGRLTARIATDDAGAFAALIAAMPQDVSRVVVQRAWMLPAFQAAFRLAPESIPETVCSLAISPTVPAPGVRLLTMADAPRMAASATLWGRTGLVDALRAGFRPFGIVRGERVIACAMAANVTAWTEEVMSVWTAPRHRTQGLGTAVVAATAADIIARGKIAIYVAAVTNRASLRVAEKVGFRRAYEIAAYRIRR
jgi:GNAT superfamily N-acetyltransferase